MPNFKDDFYKIIYNQNVPRPMKNEDIWPKSTAFPCENKSVNLALETHLTCMQAILNTIGR